MQQEQRRGRMPLWEGGIRGCCREALYSVSRCERCPHLYQEHLRLLSWLLCLYKTTMKIRIRPQSRWLCSGQSEYGAYCMRHKEHQVERRQTLPFAGPDIWNAGRAMQQHLWPVTADDRQCHGAPAHFASAPELLAAFSDRSCLCPGQGRSVKPIVI